MISCVSSSFSIILPIFTRFEDIRFLRAFVPSAEEDDQRLSVFAEINAVSGTEIYLQLSDSLPDKAVGTGIPHFHPPEPCLDDGPALPVFQVLQPFLAGGLAVGGDIVSGLSSPGLHVNCTP